MIELSDSAWVRAVENWLCHKFFKLRKSKFWGSEFFSIVTPKQVFVIPLLNNLFISFFNLFNSVTELKTLCYLITYFFSFLKGATKLYFVHYLRKVMILFSMGLRKSVFSTYHFYKTRFLFFCVLIFCVFEFNVILKDLLTYINSANTISYVLFNFVWLVPTVNKRSAKL